MTRFALTPEQALDRWFPDAGGFRDRQRDALARLWQGRSLLLLMPTGMGKSLVYQLPVLASGRVGIVISPLVALMNQQADFLEGLGANVLSLGGEDATRAQDLLRRFSWTTGPSFLFVSPERMENDGYLEYLIRKHRENIALFAVDEAHCISQWGDDFRPPYKAIPGFLDRTFGIGNWPPVLCLTATLDARSQSDVAVDFRLGRDDVLQSENMLRTNLDLSFEVFADSDEKLDALESHLASHRGEKLIVYAHLKQNKSFGTRALSSHFRDLGYACAPFDADLEAAERARILEQFTDGDIEVVFATGAFGMGIDIPDIRGVIHFLLPESLEQYYQEVGRAGRDGQQAFGVLLFTENNAKVRRSMIRSGLRTPDQIRQVWDSDCNPGRGPIRTISPWMQFQGREDDYALFYAFQRVGALSVVARGTGRLGSFEARGPEGTALLQRLANATKTKNIPIAINRLQLDPAATMESLFDLYHRGEIKLVRSPDKTLLFENRELTNSDVDGIAAEIEDRVNRRLERFDQFVAIVESGGDPTEALRARFGAASGGP